jgi:uncharacterized protein
MIDRLIYNRLKNSLETFPIVLLNGARQTGKSTLVQHIARLLDFTYITLDDYTALEAITRDPFGFLAAADGPLVVDEIQRAPKAFLAFKQLVDQDRKNGKFLLTGSANVLLLPQLADSLAGRMDVLTLWPFSCDEIKENKTNYIDNIFSKSYSSVNDPNLSHEEIIAFIVNGGYPEIQKIQTRKNKNSWFYSYITTILQRDIKDISNIEGIQEMPRLLRLLASRSGSLLNMSDISRDIGLALMTLKRYMSLLEATFIVKRLPSWYVNMGKRLVKMPKIYLTDSGLLSHILNINEERLRWDSQLMGQLLENFVMQELHKQATWSDILPEIYYYRSVAGKEVDFCLENKAGKIVGIEVKAASTVNSKDIKGLLELQDGLKARFLRGIVLYTGTKYIPLGKNLYAVPISSLCIKQPG